MGAHSHLMINRMKWLKSFSPCSSVFLSHLRIGSTRAFPRRRVCACVYRDAPMGLTGWVRSKNHTASPLRWGVGGNHSSGQTAQRRAERKLCSPCQDLRRGSVGGNREPGSLKAACLCLLLLFLWQMLSANSKRFSLVLCPLFSDAPASTVLCPFSQPSPGSHLIKDNPT